MPFQVKRESRLYTFDLGSATLGSRPLSEIHLSAGNLLGLMSDPIKNDLDLALAFTGDISCHQTQRNHSDPKNISAANPAAAGTVITQAAMMPTKCERRTSLRCGRSS